MTTAKLGIPSAPMSHHDPIPLTGVAVGLLAASIGALYTVFARYGMAHGLLPQDLTFLRFAVAGVLTLPIVALAWRRDATGLLLRWRIWLAVCALAGPPFGLLMFGALQFAPPSHAPVFPFSAMSVMGTLLAVRYLDAKLTLRKIVGIGVVLTGLIVLSGVDRASFTARALLGDAMFIAAGTCWAGFGIVLRKKGLDALLATAIVSFSALVTYVPLFLLLSGTQRLAQASASLLLIEVLVQGVIAGAGTLYAYAKMVALLGPARAAVFPALAPGLAALMGWPILGHVPTSLELLGLGVAMAGLVLTVTGTSPPRR